MITTRTNGYKILIELFLYNLCHNDEITKSLGI